MGQTLPDRHYASPPGHGRRDSEVYRDEDDDDEADYPGDGLIELEGRGEDAPWGNHVQVVPVPPTSYEGERASGMLKGPPSLPPPLPPPCLLYLERASCMLKESSLPPFPPSLPPPCPFYLERASGMSEDWALRRDGRGWCARIGERSGEPGVGDTRAPPEEIRSCLATSVQTSLW